MFHPTCEFHPNESKKKIRRIIIINKNRLTQDFHLRKQNHDNLYVYTLLITSAFNSEIYVLK